MKNRTRLKTRHDLRVPASGSIEELVKIIGKQVAKLPRDEKAKIRRKLDRQLGRKIETKPN